MYISIIDGKTWANPFISVLPPYRNQYLCIDADKAYSKLPITITLSCCLIIYSSYIFFHKNDTLILILAALMIADPVLRRALVPSKLINSSKFNLDKRFSNMLAFDFLFGFVALACGALACVSNASGGWLLIGCLIAAIAVVIGCIPFLKDKQR